jgi:hypothetical protein
MSSAGGCEVDALIEVEWAKYQLGVTSVIDLPSVGVRLLLAGVDDMEVAELAALPAAAPRPAAEDAFDKIGRARDLPFLTDPTRRLDLGRVLTDAIADGRLDAAAGADLIHRLLRWNGDGHYIEDESLHLIASYASLLDEYPESRAELLEQVVIAARVSGGQAA